MASLDRSVKRVRRDKSGIKTLLTVMAVAGLGSTVNPVWAGYQQIVITPGPIGPPLIITPPGGSVVTGLTATPVWSDSTSKWYIALSWQAASGASGYNVYRDGKILQKKVTATQFNDTAVASGEIHTYTVTPLSPPNDKEGKASNGVIVIVPAPPPAASPLLAPTNLRVQGKWTAQGATDVLSWDAPAAAVSYNVYQYDMLIASNVRGTSFSIPPDHFTWGLTYAVASVDSKGVESLPTAITGAQGAASPNAIPLWQPPLPSAPTALNAAPEWNAGRPRIRLRWAGSEQAYTYNVYRDNRLVAAGVWGTSYLDGNVGTSEKHSYYVTSVNVPWIASVESLPGGSVIGVAPSGAPPQPDPSRPVTIAGVKPNDDSVVVTFNAVPGAADYRIYDKANPNSVKYSGGALSIEWNGIDPARGATFVVEAVDKLGPFQKMDGSMGPGAMDGMGNTRVAINGQGDPSNVPNVLASSAPFTVQCQSARLTGPQAFFDDFRGEQPFARVLPLSPGLDADPANPNNLNVREFQNDRWVIRNYLGDMLSTRIFVSGNHFMETLYDGGTPFQDSVPAHNNNASLVMMPKATADISNGGVLHVTFEVDAHFNSRRWCDVIVAEAGDPLVMPGKFAENGELPTKTGNVFRWEVTAEFHNAQVFQGVNGNLVRTDLIDLSWNPGNDRFDNPRIRWDGFPLLNGTGKDLDHRHRFDLYLSRTRFRIIEDGVVCKDRDFPAGVTLPFTRAAVYFVHQLYHTGNDRPELIQWSPSETYWIDHRPWADERHWDNMGFEVLPAFPK